MNPWPFVLSAYALTAAGVAGTSLLFWRALRRAEQRADDRGRHRDASS